MDTTMSKNYFYLLEKVFNSKVTCPPPYLATTTAPKKCSRIDYSLFSCVVVTLLVFTLMPACSTAAPLTQQTNTESDFLESAESMLDLLDKLVRLRQREHNFGDAAEEFGDKQTLMRRLYKRHNAAYKSDGAPEWQNVCGHNGVWSSDEVPEDLYADYIQLYMKTLRQSVRLEYKALKSKGSNDIDINDMKAWARHYRKYKFLPTLEHNSAVTPVCWHQSMQKFIASFAYLYKIQQHWDQQNLRTQSGIAKDLHGLLQSAQRMQCEIETAIRGSFPSDKQQLTTYTRDEMLALINFYTKDPAEGGAAAGLRGVHPTDLRFAKFFYQNYLLRIWKSLPRHLKNIQLDYTCNKHNYHAILEHSLDTEEYIVNSEIHDESGE